MKFETLKKNQIKKVVIGMIAIVAIAMVGIFATSRAKYRNTQSIPLVRGIINYKAYDFKVMAMYQQKDGQTCTEDTCYDEITIMPNSGYEINESKSYCTLDNKNKDENAVLKTINGNHTINNLSKSDKCYLYFDKLNSIGEDVEINKNSASLETLVKLNLTANVGTVDFSKIADSNNGIYKSIDDYGISYYWRGAVENNYLKFANKWWRIIRINGDGTIRIIYDGTSYHANGTSTADSIAKTSVEFNNSKNDNAYAGFMYGATGSSDYNKTHENINKSNIMKELETWYNNNLASYALKIDTNAGFCGDRTRSTYEAIINNNGGTGNTSTYYGAYIRLYSNKIPSLECPQVNDLYTIRESSSGNKAMTYPIGLISADEVALAGGVYPKGNRKYYLYNGQNYWTMSPQYCNGSTFIFRIDNSGALINSSSGTPGMRPVINLRADVTITGSGTENDPYIVS